LVRKKTQIIPQYYCAGGEIVLFLIQPLSCSWYSDAMKTRRESPAALLLGRHRAALLEFLLSQPEATMHLREIARRASVPVGVVQRELAVFTELGLVSRTPSGRRVEFTVLGQSPLTAPLSEIIVQSGGIPAAIRAALSGLASEIRFAAVFGSVLVDPEGSRRDVDLIVVGTASYDAVLAKIDPLAMRWQREFNLRVMTEAGFDRQRNASTRSLLPLLNGPRVMLIGEDHQIKGS
jgi:uncharacterized protein